MRISFIKKSSQIQLPTPFFGGGIPFFYRENKTKRPWVKVFSGEKTNLKSESHFSTKNPMIRVDLFGTFGGSFWDFRWVSFGCWVNNPNDLTSPMVAGSFGGASSCT